MLAKDRDPALQVSFKRVVTVGAVYSLGPGVAAVRGRSLPTPAIQSCWFLLYNVEGGSRSVSQNLRFRQNCSNSAF